jgi:outer membrane protein
MHISLRGWRAVICKCWRSIMALLACAGLPGGVMADEQAVAPNTLPPDPSDWTVTLGVEAAREPLFEGSTQGGLRFYPYFDVRRAGTPEHFRSPRDSFSFTLIDQTSFQLGAVAMPRFPRREHESRALQGLGDVPWAVELGGFVEFWYVPWLRARTEVRQGIGGHHGVVADLMTDVVLPITTQLTWSGGPRVTFMTKGATSPYFSIDPMQSVASGLPEFDAHGGLHSAGLGTQAKYRWTPEWATHAFLEYARLMGDAAHSPLVVQRGTPNEMTLGVGVTHSFDIKQFW